MKVNIVLPEPYKWPPLSILPCCTQRSRCSFSFCNVDVNKVRMSYSWERCVFLGLDAYPLRIFTSDIEKCDLLTQWIDTQWVTIVCYFYSCSRNLKHAFTCRVLLPHFYQLLLVVSWSLVILPELVYVYVADGNDQDVAAVDHEKKNPFKKDDWGVITCSYAWKDPSMANLWVGP